MTDAPRATPPIPERAGWFEDPDDTEQLRYFDGIIWTKHTTPRRTIWQVPTTEQQAAEQAAQPSTYVGHDAHAGAPGQPTSGQSTTGPYGYPTQSPHTQAPHGQQYQQPNPYQQQYQQPYQRHQVVPAGPVTKDGAPLASMASRFAAWLIDSALTWVIGLVLGGFLLWRGLGNYPQVVADAVSAGTTSPADAAALAEQIQFDLVWLGAFAVVQLLVGVGYHTYFLSRSGATPGRRAAGISVRLAERPGVLSPADAMRRSLLRPVLFLFTYTPGLGLFAMPFSLLDAVSAFWHPQRQTLHDRIGGTVVVAGPQPRKSASGGNV